MLAAFISKTGKNYYSNSVSSNPAHMPALPDHQSPLRTFNKQGMRGQGRHRGKTVRYLSNDHTGEGRENFQEALFNHHSQGRGEGGRREGTPLAT